MRFVAAAVGTLFAMAPEGASAQSWYRVGGDARHMSYVDLTSVQALGGKIVAATKTIYTNELVAGTGVYSSVIRSEFDCPGHSFRPLEFTYFNMADSPISPDSGSSDEHKAPSAGSTDEKMFQFVCYRTGGTLVTDPYDDMRRELPKYRK